MWAEMSRHIADSLILPLDVVAFKDFLLTNARGIATENEQLFRANNLTDDLSE